MKVKEIMTKEIISLLPDMSAKEALEVLFKNRISGLPVITAEGKLVGMFTEKGILRWALPSYLEQVGRFVYEENPKAIKKKMADLIKVKVEDLMRKEVMTVGEDTTLCEVARVMLTQRVRRIPVINKEGKIVGIVAREDIVKSFTKEVE
jgi:CBS domain-containing protein